MNEINNGAMDMVSAGIVALLVIIGLVVWFFVNRASVKASQQVQLLEALLEEQKRQNAMLRRLTDAVAGKEQGAAAKDDADSKDFTRLITER
ncbi:YebO family protein [Erwinia aphidicola]|uniref:YebO family protein n=1 Tax=Erwinia aphidicola TaxID=68334 RepID=UPI0030CB2462